MRKIHISMNSRWKKIFGCSINHFSSFLFFGLEKENGPEANQFYKTYSPFSWLEVHISCLEPFHRGLKVDLMAWVGFSCQKTKEKRKEKNQSRRSLGVSPVTPIWQRFWMFTINANKFWQVTCKTPICNHADGLRVEALSMTFWPNEAVRVGFGWDLFLKQVFFISVKTDDYGSLIFSSLKNLKLCFLVVAKRQKNVHLSCFCL